MSFNNDYLSGKLNDLRFNVRLMFDKVKSSLEQVRTKIKGAVSRDKIPFTTKSGEKSSDSKGTSNKS